MLGVSRQMVVSDSVVIAGVTPGQVYDEISDVTSMGRWSPENNGATVAGQSLPGSGQAPFVGMTFVGHNKRGPLRWQTGCIVTAADHGSRFAFRVARYSPLPVRPVLPIAVASWEYQFEAVDGGTKVTEIWTDNRTLWPDVVADRFDRFATGGRPFREFQLRNIQKTLGKLKLDFESR